MNLNRAIIEEIYNAICQHLPNRYQEILDLDCPLKRIIAEPGPWPQAKRIYLHKYTATIQMISPRIVSMIDINDNTITIKNTIKSTINSTPICASTTQYELTNPNTNIPQIIQIILTLLKHFN